MRSSFSYARPTGSRDRAIILTLLDTGLRAMESCSLKACYVNFKTGRVSVAHGVAGGTKGGRGRVFSAGLLAEQFGAT